MEEKIFNNHLEQFMSDVIKERPEFSEYALYPCLNDDTLSTGFDEHYIYHVAWAIKKILQNKPAHHVDVSSSLNFCTAICSTIPTTFIDYRPAQLYLDQLTCVQGDLTVDFAWENIKYESLSCMHVIEHIGLGRYGDLLDVNGDIKAMKNLIKSVSQKGRLLLVVPIGKPKIFFNAHRVYSASWIKTFFENFFKLNEFYFIPSINGLKPIINCDLSYTENFDYGCGCFEFIERNDLDPKSNNLFTSI